MRFKLIAADRQENAKRMLMQRADFHCWVGNIRYYVLDGLVWSWPYGGKVSVCNDQSQTAGFLRVHPRYECHNCGENDCPGCQPHPSQQLSCFV